MKEVFVRSPYNYDVKAVSDENGLFCPPEEGMTQQHFQEECDINEIVRRFGFTGELPENPRMPVSGDFTGVVDFHSALNLVREAEGAFMEFPAELRARFRNDPGELIAFLSEDSNRDEAVKLGLVKAPTKEERTAVQAVDELAAVLKPKA